MKVSNSISNEVGFENKKTGGWISTRVYKQVAKAKLYLIKTQLFMAALDVNK